MTDPMDEYLDEYGIDSRHHPEDYLPPKEQGPAREPRVNATVSLTVEGHLLIRDFADSDRSDPRVLLNKRNAVHPENMSVGIARAMAGLDSGQFYTMHFGTGGATIDPTGSVIYASPNVSGAADLNVPVYFEVVDSDRGGPQGNSMNVRHLNDTSFSDVEIRCVIDKNEPVGQLAFDNLAQNNSDGGFVFDEIGLKTDDGLLLTHVTFNPIQKSANRILEVLYTLRYRVV